MPTDGTFGAPKSPATPRSPRKMTKEEITATTDRLTRSPPRRGSLPPLVALKKLSKEDLDRSTERLYTQAMHHHKVTVESAEKKAHPDLRKHVTLDEDSLDSAFSRMYAAADARKANLDRLRKRYDDQETAAHCSTHSSARNGGGGGGGAAGHTAAGAPGTPRVLNADEVKNSSRRLHDECLERQKARYNALIEKYVTSNDVKSARMSSGELMDSVSRLSSRK